MERTVIRGEYEDTLEAPVTYKEREKFTEEEHIKYDTVIVNLATDSLDVVDLMLKDSKSSIKSYLFLTDDSKVHLEVGNRLKSHVFLYGPRPIYFEKERGKVNNSFHENLLYGYFGGDITKPPLKSFNKLKDLPMVVDQVSPALKAKIAFVNCVDKSVTYFAKDEAINSFRNKCDTVKREETVKSEVGNTWIQGKDWFPSSQKKDIRKYFVSS